jgi:hypothetical protein
MGKHDKHVVEFVQKNLDTLARLPSAFFSVSLAARGDTQEAEGYVDQFEAETGWRPDQVAMFGGALLYTHYGFIKRHMMKKDRPGQARTPRPRPVPRLRLHRMGRRQAVRRALRRPARGTTVGMTISRSQQRPPPTVVGAVSVTSSLDAAMQRWRRN